VPGTINCASEEISLYIDILIAILIKR